MEYRRLNHRETWHWMTGCQHWRAMTPEKADRWTAVFRIENSRPSWGELCNECRGKEKGEKR